MDAYKELDKEKLIQIILDLLNRNAMLERELKRMYSKFEDKE